MKRLLFAVLGIGLFTTSPLLGQVTREGVMHGFDRNAPAIGEPLPNLRAYDATGQTIQLGEFKGCYTVLVFGCLT
ncbi:MAG: hypothetical protein H6822_10910 [Planctomycetaceae bacterium]|nr:hypothetical protein [Planctomycetales bacterium]MCB9922684.1 hypothetical protein [Planctomycetaceae bacterium]